MITHCDCGHTVDSKNHSPGTGYGTDKDGKTFCYPCAGKNDRAELEAATPGKKFTLYYEDSPTVSPNGKQIYGFVTNWPGTLRIPTYQQKSNRHNFGGWRTDFWFNVGAAKFHGYQIGDNNAIAHIRCIKG